MDDHGHTSCVFCNIRCVFARVLSVQQVAFFLELFVDPCGRHRPQRSAHRGRHYLNLTKKAGILCHNRQQLVPRKSKPQTILDKNAKSQRILTILRALDFEYTSKRTQNSLTAKLLIFKYWRQNISLFYIHIQQSLFRMTLLTEQCCCPQGMWDHATVNPWNIRLHRSNSLASQQSWPQPRSGGSCRSV